MFMGISWSRRISFFLFGCAFLDIQGQSLDWPNYSPETDLNKSIAFSDYSLHLESTGTLRILTMKISEFITIGSTWIWIHVRQSSLAEWPSSLRQIVFSLFFTSNVASVRLWTHQGKLTTFSVFQDWGERLYFHLGSWFPVIHIFNQCVIHLSADGFAGRSCFFRLDASSLLYGWSYRNRAVLRYLSLNSYWWAIFSRSAIPFRSAASFSSFRWWIWLYS